MIGLAGLIGNHFTRRRAEDEARVLAALSHGPRMVYQVCETTGLSGYRTYNALIRLEAAGRVVAPRGDRRLHSVSDEEFDHAHVDEGRREAYHKWRLA